MANTYFSGPVNSANGFVAAAGGADVTGAVQAKTSLAVGSGTALTKIVKGSISVNPPSIATLAAAVVTLTITGAVAGDVVVINPGTVGFTAGICLSSPFVSAADTVKVTVINMTAGTLDEAALACDYILIRS